MTRRAKMVGRLAGLALSLSALTAAPSLSQAESFQFAADQDYPPFTGTDLPGRGLAVEVVEAALASQGHEADIVLRPRTRAYSRTVGGHFDGVFPFPWTPGRALEAEPSKPLFELVPQVISSTQDPVRFDGTGASLAGHTLCQPAGHTDVALVEELIDAGRVTTISPASSARCPALVQLDRADFWIQSNFVWPSVIAESDYSENDFHIAESGFPPVKLHLFVGKAHPDTFRLIRIIDDGLVAIKSNGTFDDLVARHVRGSE